MPKAFTIYRPGAAFPAISVTGERCTLRCEHCKGHFLRGMLPADTPERLMEVARKARERGATGVLISGGCEADGMVPLSPFLGAISRLHGNGLYINVHGGLLNEIGVRELVATGADVFSVDLLQDEGTIRGSLHLDAGPEDYERTIRSLISAGATVVPHVCVGLQPPEGEEKCLEILRRLDIAGLVVLALMPLPGAEPMEGLDSRLVRFVERASRNQAPVLVGCMRPRGHWETEVRCIQAGAAGMVSPSMRTMEWLRRNGYDIIEKETCCALHHMVTIR